MITTLKSFASTLMPHPKRSKRRKIILHMGLQKTGTTTIQNVLHTNRERLLMDCGVLCPAYSENLTTPLCTMFHDDPRRQHVAVRLMGQVSDEQLANLRRSHTERLEDEIRQTEWTTLLLSAEGVCKLNDDEMARLKAWGDQFADEWSVIVCLRHPVAYVRSIIQQLLKGGDRLDHLYQNPELPQFQARLMRASRIFGDVRIFDFDRAVSSPDGLVGTFATLCGIDGLAKDLIVSRAKHDNESMSAEAVHVLDALNALHPLIVNGVRNPTRPDRALAFVQRIEGQKFELPSEVVDNVRGLVRNDVVWLNEAHGMDLYRDILEPKPISNSTSYAPFSPDAIASVATLIGELALKP